MFKKLPNIVRQEHIIFLTIFSKFNISYFSSYHLLTFFFDSRQIFLSIDCTLCVSSKFYFLNLIFEVVSWSSCKRYFWSIWKMVETRGVNCNNFYFGCWLILVTTCIKTLLYFSFGFRKGMKFKLISVMVLLSKISVIVNIDHGFFHSQREFGRA